MSRLSTAPDTPPIDFFVFEVVEASSFEDVCIQVSHDASDCRGVDVQILPENHDRLPLFKTYGHRLDGLERDSPIEGVSTKCALPRCCLPSGRWSGLTKFLSDWARLLAALPNE